MTIRQKTKLTIRTDEPSCKTEKIMAALGSACLMLCLPAGCLPESEWRVMMSFGVFSKKCMRITRSRQTGWPSAGGEYKRVWNRLKTTSSSGIKNETSSEVSTQCSGTRSSTRGSSWRGPAAAGSCPPCPSHKGGSQCRKELALLSAERGSRSERHTFCPLASFQRSHSSKWLDRVAKDDLLEVLNSIKKNGKYNGWKTVIQ